MSERERARESRRERAGERERTTPIHAVFDVAVTVIVIVQVNGGTFTQLHLGCEDTKSERARERESKRARKSEKSRERARESE